MSARCPRLSAITTWIVFGLLAVSAAGTFKNMELAKMTREAKEEEAKAEEGKALELAEVEPKEDVGDQDPLVAQLLAEQQKTNQLLQALLTKSDKIVSTETAEQASC